jgi:hypothetical protein
MDFLQIREDYKLAYHRWEQCAEKLCHILHCDFATLEQALLVPSGHRHAALVQEYARLGIALDQASDKWDTAQMLQSRATAAVNRDLQTVEC